MYGKLCTDDNDKNHAEMYRFKLHDNIFHLKMNLSYIRSSDLKYHLYLNFMLIKKSQYYFKIRYQSHVISFLTEKSQYITFYMYQNENSVIVLYNTL